MNWDFQYWTSLSDSQQTAFLARYIDTVDSGYYWGNTSITYSFPNIRTGYEFTPYVPAGEALRYSPMDAQEKAFVRFFFSYVESFVGLDFEEVSGLSGDILLGKHNMDTGGYADYPYDYGKSGVFMNSQLDSSEYGNYAYTVMTHEIGHSLGLSHTRNYDGMTSESRVLPAELDTSFLSAMTYSDMATDDTDSFTSALMPLDIAALIDIYGARFSNQSNVFRIVDQEVMPSASGNVWSISGKFPFTIVDTGGFDTVDASGYTDSDGALFVFDEGLWLTSENPFNQLSYYINASDRPWVDLTGQTDVVPMVGIFPDTVIEKFIGTRANDHVYGDANSQQADGGAGTDTFYVEGLFGGYDISVESGTGDVIIADIDFSNGNTGTDRLSNFELVSFAGQAPIAVQDLLPPVIWYEDRENVTMVAATWQLMMDMVPERAGFEYLIASPSNPNDLNDAYFAEFNLENTYLNFACNLAFEIPQSLAWYEAEFGNLTFAQAVNKAVTDIIGTGNAADFSGALSFFLGARPYYQQVALERVVRPGISLDDATKVAMLSSVLYESVKADTGPYAAVVEDFADEVSFGGLSDSFGESLFV